MRNPQAYGEAVRALLEDAAKGLTETKPVRQRWLRLLKEVITFLQAS